MSDCGADTDRTFDDLGSAVRRAREDFGVNITIHRELFKIGTRLANRVHSPSAGWNA